MALHALLGMLDLLEAPHLVKDVLSTAHQVNGHQCALSALQLLHLCARNLDIQTTLVRLKIIIIMMYRYHMFITGASIYNDERYGRNGTVSSFNYLSCSSSANSLSDCTEYSKGSGCFVSTGTCYREYGIKCYSM